MCLIRATSAESEKDRSGQTVIPHLMLCDRAALMVCAAAEVPCSYLPLKYEAPVCDRAAIH